MAYEKTVWVNGQAPALDADHLNKIEQGIADAVSVTPQTLSDAQKAQARGNINAAPGGYGLGDNAKFLTADDDLNSVLTTGWYSWAWNNHPENAPDNNWRDYGTAMHVFSTAPGAYAIQTVYDLSDDITHGCAIQRTIYMSSSGNIYYPWEWVNPPMLLGTEYRTTERYLGKPVYVKTFNIPTSVFTNQKVSYAHGITNLDRIVNAFVCCRADAIRIFPWSYYDTTNWSAQYMVTNTTVNFELGSEALSRINEFSNGVDVTLKYTKTTD